MSLNETVLNMLNEFEGQYKESAEQGNPPPANGIYSCLLTKVKCGKRKTKKGEQTVVTLAFEVLNEGEFAGYRFSQDLWLANPMAHVLLSSMAACSAGKPVGSIGEAYQLVADEAGKGAFDIEVTRDTVKKDGVEKTYCNVKALRKVEIDPS